MLYTCTQKIICHLIPSAIGLQQMLNECLSFCIRNDIVFNPVKSVCVAFQSQKEKKYIVLIMLH